MLPSRIWLSIVLDVVILGNFPVLMKFSGGLRIDGNIVMGGESLDDMPMDEYLEEVG